MRFITFFTFFLIFGTLFSQKDSTTTGISFTRVEKDSIWCINSEGLYGAVNKSNEVLIPFIYASVSKELYNKPNCYIAILPNGGGAFYSLAGETLLEFEFEKVQSICTQQEKFYLRITKKGKTALGFWDVDAKKIVLLTKFEFEYIDCKSTTQEPFASGHYKDGTHVLLFKNGTKQKPSK